MDDLELDAWQGHEEWREPLDLVEPHQESNVEVLEPVEADSGAPAPSFPLATLEALHGARSPMQLRRWLSPPVHAALQARAAVISRAGGTPPRIGLHSCRLLEMSEGCVEVFAVVEVGARCRAVALRMQTYDGRWRVTALEMG